VNLLVGTWIPTQAELGGIALPDEDLARIKLLIGEDRYKVIVDGRIDQGTLKVDKSRIPKTMEIVGTKGPNEGKTILAIYEVVGDNLTICYDLSGQAFPEDFESKPGTQLYLVNYQRES
jgi:uncharacterized protein (TIGR03067 family)